MVEEEGIDNEEPKTIDVWREISLKHGEIHLGELGLQSKGKNKLLIKIVKKDLKGKEEIILAPEEVPIDFYEKPKIRDKVFKHVKNALKADEQYNKFIDGLRFKIEKWKLEQEEQPKKEIKPLEVSEEEKRTAELFKKANLESKLKVIKILLQSQHVGDTNSLVTGFYVALSSLVDPLMLKVGGSSSVGKNSFIRAILSTLPENIVLNMGPMSAQVVRHIKWEEMDELKIVCIPDIDVDNETKNLRFFSGDDNVTHFWVEGSAQEGFETSNRTIPTKTLILATTAAHLDRQLENRTVVINLDESEEQTKKVLEREADEVEDKYKPQSTLWLQYYIEQLQSFDKIVVPFAKHLTKILNTKNLRVRRDYKKMLSIIKVSAYLCQNQRPQSKGILFALPEDFFSIFPYWRNTFEETISGLTGRKKVILNILDKEPIADKYYSEIKIGLEKEGIKRGIRSIREDVNDLEDMGLVFVDRTQKIHTVVSTDKTDDVLSINIDEVKKQCEISTKDYLEKRGVK